jgi:glycine betaine transporter
MMTTEGDLDPSFKIKVFWGLVLATITAALLIGGGLDALRAAALVFAFPFSLVLILIALSLYVRLNVHIGKERV